MAAEDPLDPGAPAETSPMVADAEWRSAMLATSGGILSAQQRAERELRAARSALEQRNLELDRANALLHATLDATPVGVLATGTDGAVTLHNQRFDTLWTLTGPQIDAHGVTVLFDVLGARLCDPAAFLAWVRRLKARPGAAERLQCETLDGHHLECDAQPQWADGRCVGMVYNWLDVTERVEAETLRSQARAAELANQAKSEFMSRASHELRTPLNAVLGFAQLLQMQTVVAGDGRASSHVRHIMTAGGHLLALMDDLLQVSRIESGLLRLNPEAIDLPAAVAEALVLSEPVAAQRTVRFENRCLAPAVAWADRTRLRQVLMNLLSNAIKYNRPGGLVVLRCRPGGPGHQIEVEDTGQGMSAEQVAHLFEPFNRLGAERSRVEGTGLGLVITRQLAELMGGAVEVRSTLGQGSVFTLSLPGRAPI